MAGAHPAAQLRGVYYLIFGILFKANRGIEHYIPYLVIGVFIFTFTERSILTGSRVMHNNLSLIRALQFPGRRCRWPTPSWNFSSCCCPWWSW